MAILVFMALVPMVWCFYNTCCLLVNYRRASQLDIPIICVPISPDNPLWIALQTAFSSSFKYISFDAFSVTRYCRLGWEFHDRFKTHLRLGDVWILVTPNKNWLHIAQAETAHDIFLRNRDFGRPVWMMSMLNVFGPNVSTAEGSDWQRQRKLTATPFNEQKSSLVWAESLRQANDMIEAWLPDKKGELRSTTEDTRTLALHVLAYAGFQKSYPFASTPKDDAAPRSTYRDALSLILKNILVILVLPSAVFRIPLLPSKWKQIGWAVTEFRQYMLEQLADEEQLITEGKPGSGTLISNLLRASRARPDEKAIMDGRAHEFKALSVDEILGNIFVFNFAGHDTTAITLAYGVLLLVAHPEAQDWIAEELNFFLDNKDIETWKYDDVFPKLKRCSAVLHETLRLYNPLPGIPKYTGHQSQLIHVGRREFSVPENTIVVPNLMALQTHPRYWGSDSLTWRPSRWILSSSESKSIDLDTRLAQESLLLPNKGTFVAWSEGARSCPGKKFAQVEFVATMAALFRNYRAEPVSLFGETPDAARKRVLEVVKDSNVELLLQMRNPESVSVKWSSR